jgi:hypothetical protein
VSSEEVRLPAIVRTLDELRTELGISKHSLTSSAPIFAPTEPCRLLGHPEREDRIAITVGGQADHHW